MAKVTEDQLINSFPLFLTHVWHQISLPRPTAKQYEIAEYIEDPTKMYRMVAAFRGEGKSFVSAAYAAWCLLRDRHIKIMVISATHQRAIEFSTMVQSLIDKLEILKDLRPTENTKRWSRISFDVIPNSTDQSPSVKSLGIESMLTGTRADLVIFDDIEIPKNSATPSSRAKILAAAMEVVAAVLKPKTGRVLILGTPQSHQTIYRVFWDKGFDKRFWPAQVPSAEEVFSDYEGCLAPSIEALALTGHEGEPTDPERFDLEELLRRKAFWGPTQYDLQFQLKTRLSDAQKFPLRTSDFIVTNLPSSVPPRAPISIGWSMARDKILQPLESLGFSGDCWRDAGMVDQMYDEFTNSVMFIDPSGRGKDELAYAVVKMLNGVLYLTRSGGMLEGYSDANLETLARIAKEEQVRICVIEANFGDGMFLHIFRPILAQIHPKSGLEEVRVNIQKEKRIINTLEPVISQHRLVVTPSVIEMDLKVIDEVNKGVEYSLFYQLTHITLEKGSLLHDDRLDALAGAVGYYVTAMGLDSVKAADHARKNSDSENMLDIARAKRRKKEAAQKKRQSAAYSRPKLGLAGHRSSFLKG